MTNKVKIHFSSKPNVSFFHDDSGTNRIVLEKDRAMHIETDEVYVLEYRLFDNDVTKKFIEVWNSNKDEATIDFNSYSKLLSSEILEKQKLMNEVILDVNEFKFKDWRISDNLILELNGNLVQLDKLNALHRFFEDCSYDLMKEGELGTIQQVDYELLFRLLERINYLVHRMEAGASDDLQDFYVFRNGSARLKDKVRLIDADYNLFVPTIRETINQLLFLDYATVGKDLEACMNTNDLELIRNKEVKQQLYINSAMNFTFNQYAKATEMTIKEYTTQLRSWKNTWCEKNNVGDYLDYKLPMFNQGRIILGECIDEEIKDATSFRRMTNKFPYINAELI